MLELGIHDDAKFDDLVVLVERGERVEERDAHALLEHAAGEVVRNLEVEGAGHARPRLDEVEEAVQLGSDAVVAAELGSSTADQIPGSGRRASVIVLLMLSKPTVMHRVIHLMWGCCGASD